jgi:hypothetical protein
LVGVKYSAAFAARSVGVSAPQAESNGALKASAMRKRGKRARMGTISRITARGPCHGAMIGLKCNAMMSRGAAVVTRA